MTFKHKVSMTQEEFANLTIEIHSNL
jgi:hypothetical protein